jgi:hypothetical protein
MNTARRQRRAVFCLVGKISLCGKELVDLSRAFPQGCQQKLWVTLAFSFPQFLLKPLFITLGQER